MKRNKGIRVFLGILLTAFLLIPNGLSIKAEDLTEPSSHETVPEVTLEEKTTPEEVEPNKEELEKTLEIEPDADVPNEEEPPVDAPDDRSDEEIPEDPQALKDEPAEEKAAPEEDPVQKAAAVSKEERTVDLMNYHGELRDLNFLQYMEWLKSYFSGLDLPSDLSFGSPLGFLPEILDCLDIDPKEILKENLRVLTVMKHWHDGEDKRRPPMVVAKLLANGTTVGYLPLWKGLDYKLDLLLPKKDLKGNAIAYQVEEIVPKGYIGMVEEEGNTFHIHNHKAMKLSVEKIWMDDFEEIRPESITYEVLANGIVYGDQRMLTKENGWMEEFSVPQYDEEGEIDYTLLEEPMEGYSTAYEVDMPMEAKMAMGGEKNDTKEKMLSLRIINTFTNEKDITLKKIWVDDSKEMRPEQLEMVLYQDGMAMETILLEGPDWEAVKTVPLYDMESLEKHLYEVAEEKVPDGYEAAVEGLTVTNTWVGVTEYLTISGEKTWDDLRGRPGSITVMLYRGDEMIEEKTVTPDEEGRWLYTFSEQPKYDDMGIAYAYRVEERFITGYDVEYSDYNIKNIQQRATLRILKVNDIGQPLAGAVFEVRTALGEVIGSLTTGADGTASMILPLGIYRVVETAAPEGYELGNINRMVILFTKDQVVTTEIVNEFIEIEDVEPLPLPEDEDDDHLPKTGVASGSMFYLLGLFSLMAGGVSLRRKNKNGAK